MNITTANRKHTTQEIAAIKRNLDKLAKKAETQILAGRIANKMLKNVPGGTSIKQMVATGNKAVKLARKGNKKIANDYLSDEKLQEHMEKIHDYIFKTSVDGHGRHACKMIAKGFTFVIPHVDRYEMDMSKCYIKEAHLERHYRKDWLTMDEEYRSKIRRNMKRYNKLVKESMEQLVNFSNRQALHLNGLDDETAELVLDLEETEVEVQTAADLRTYIKPASEVTENYLMKPEEICKYLITVSKGVCIYWPTNIGKELSKRGFKSAEAGYYVELVR